MSLSQAAELSPLNEDTLTQLLLERYFSDQIYTWVGAALVCVRPSCALPLYCARAAAAAAAPAPHAPPPHPYSVMAEAYRWVRDRDEDQLIIITGVSGSGKTETARVCVQWACVVAAGGGAGGVASLLPAAAAVLEAFGNAATRDNHNASRHGRLVELRVDAAGTLRAARIEPYLLEKSRVVCLGGEGERTFHALHQLLAADVRTRERLKLRGGARRSWRVAGGAGGGGVHASCAAAMDADQLAHTQECLSALGVAAEEVWLLLAALLKLGEARFYCGGGGAQETRLHDDTVEEWREACELLGVEADALLRSLNVSEGPSPPATPPRGAHSPPASPRADDGGAAAWARDALIQDIYELLFFWLVRKINSALSGEGVGAETRGGRGGGWVGVADVPGWEHSCGAETLAFNYAADALQAALDQESRSRVSRGVSSPRRVVTSPRRVASLLVASPAELVAADLHTGPESVVSLLAAEGAGGAGGEGWRGFMRRLQEVAHDTVTVLPPHCFRVCHYAGAVQYDARALWAERGGGGGGAGGAGGRAGAVLARATLPLLAELLHQQRDATEHRGWRGGCGCGSGGSGGSGRRAARVQRVRLAALCARAAAGEARSLRCVTVHAHTHTPARLHAYTLRNHVRTHRLVEEALVYRATWHHSAPAAAWLPALAALRPPGPLGPPGVPPAPATCRTALSRVLAPHSFSVVQHRVYIHTHNALSLVEYSVCARREVCARRVQRWWRRVARPRPPRPPRPEPHPELHHYSAAARALCAWWRRVAARRWLVAVARECARAGTSPLSVRAWSPPPAPPELRHARALLRDLYHANNCAVYRRRLDSRARLRLREKLTASLLLRGRKANYADSVAHPFRGDYLRLRAHPAYSPPAPHDRLLFADFATQVCVVGGDDECGAVRVRRCVVALWGSGAALLGARSLRLRRHVPPATLHALALSTHADNHLALLTHTDTAESSGEEDAPCSSHTCLFSGGTGAGSGRAGGRGDVLLQCAHALELATKLHLVAHNHAAPLPLILNNSLELRLGAGRDAVSVQFVEAGEGGGGGGEGGGGALEPEGGRYVLRRRRLLVLV